MPFWAMFCPMVSYLTGNLVSDQEVRRFEAILACSRDWHATMAGWQLSCVFFDLSKAFDSLAHSLVLASLARVGVCGSLLAWFENYLQLCFILNCLNITNSKTNLIHVLDGVSSDLAGISPSPSPTSGVPQGSILSPLLFILAVDTISDPLIK